MTTYTTYEIRSGVFAIEEGAVQMYLIVGSREALLLDTGSGAGDLRGLVRGLTALPVTVALTHGHNDHTGGAPQFGTAYAHKMTGLRSGAIWARTPSPCGSCGAETFSTWAAA